VGGEDARADANEIDRRHRRRDYRCGSISPRSGYQPSFAKAYCSRERKCQLGKDDFGPRGAIAVPRNQLPSSITATILTMPQTVTFLVGLPGSGKSSFLKQRAEVVFDDSHTGAFRDSPAFTATPKNGWGIVGMETEQAGNAARCDGGDRKHCRVH